MGKWKELLSQPEIIQLCWDVTNAMPGAKEMLAERLAQTPVPQTVVNSKIYAEQEEDVRQKFLLKILNGKVLPEANKPPYPYVYTIVKNLWIDLLKKRSREKKIFAPCGAEEPSDAEEQKRKKILDSCEDFFSGDPERKKWLASLDCEARIVLKMTQPYLFGFTWEEDERDLLQRKYKQDPDLLLKILREEWAKAFEKGKNHIPTKILAPLLQKNPNAFDKTLSRIREKIPWLKKKNEKICPALSESEADLSTER